MENAMTKLLNIDALKKEERIITLGGISYPMKDMSVADFISISTMAEESDAKENQTAADRVMFLVDSVAVSFPTCPKEILMACDFDSLNIIAAFARDGSLPDELKETSEAEFREKK